MTDALRFLQLHGRRIEYELAPGAGDAPVIVFLHEGLGSVAMWRDFPRKVAQATGCGMLVYSRYGHGASDALTAPRKPDFMHDEAMSALPVLLDALNLEFPILFGHSDGASIALINAATPGRKIGGVIALAPHVMVEEISITSIRRARAQFESGKLRNGLARYHDHVDAMFYGWNDIWLAPEFRNWSIEDVLPRIACPVLAIQGEDDEYGTMRQIERIAELAPDVRLLKLDQCGHSPHRDQPEAVLAAVVGFVRNRLG